MLFSQAIVGFLMFKEAGGLRPRTLSLYRYHLTQFVDWRGDQPLEAVTAADVNEYMVYLRTEYRPSRFDGDDRPLSSQSLYISYTAFQSFYRWARESLDVADVITGQVPRPKVVNEKPVPFTEVEVKSLLAAVRPARGPRATSGLYYLTDLRDKSILFTLLDTGIRAGELCALTVGDLHPQTGLVTIANGKGGKSRNVWLGKHARPGVWRYLQERPTSDPADPLFASSTNRAITPSALAKRLKKIGRRAGVAHVHPHRFRYTFAIQFLRNGGDIFTLQQILGHTTLTMVQYYLRLAQTDMEQAHRRASPVDNWLK